MSNEVVKLKNENEALKKQLEEQSKIAGLNGTCLSIVKNQSFKSYALSRGLTEKQFERALGDFTAYLGSDKIKQDIKKADSVSLVQAFINIARSGLRLGGLSPQVYIIPYEKSKKTGKKDKNGEDIYEVEKTTFSVQADYKGLVSTAFEYGYEIHCQYILYSELDYVDIDPPIKKITHKNIARRLGLPTIPVLKYTKSDINEKLYEYDFKPSDICSFYAYAIDRKAKEIIDITQLSLAETMERAMEDDTGWDSVNKKKVCKGRKIKNQMIKNYLDNIEKDALGRRTDAIEALKIRVIRYLLKTIPVPALQELATKIDTAEGYIDVTPVNQQTPSIKNITPPQQPQATVSSISQAIENAPPLDPVQDFPPQEQVANGAGH